MDALWCVTYALGHQGMSQSYIYVYNNIFVGIQVQRVTCDNMIEGVDLQT